MSPREVALVVSDPGKGIEPSQLRSIFDSFVQLHAGAGRGQGLGLGLALCRKLVEMHGGSIEAHSEGVGRGSQFRIRLPRTRELAAPARSSPPVALVPPARRKLMVVDDNVDCADSLAMLLRLEGYEAVVAYDGHSALATASTEAPAVVFVDMCLPDMTGREVVTGIRQSGGAVPAFIALSGMEADEAQAPSGFAGYLVKPVGMAEIRHALAALERGASPLH